MKRTIRVHSHGMSRVGVVEDEPEIREGLTLLIRANNDLDFGGAWPSMEEAIPAINGNTPDVLLVDLQLPGMGGVEGINFLKEKHPKLLMLVLTVYDDDDRIFQAVCAGACGYLLKR